MFNFIPKSRRSIHRSIAMAILCSPLFITANAQAVPLPKDWCGRLWEVQTATGNNAVAGWTNPATGVSSPTAPPNVAAIPTLLATGSFTTLGIHARSGTLYTLDRNTSILYQYSMATGGTAWTTTQLTMPNINTANFNKMTVTGDQLLIARTDSLILYTYTITPATGALASTSVTPTTLTFDGQTILPPRNTLGNPPGTTAIGGGDIAQDEYGDTYMVTYDNSAATTQYAYFYKLNGTQWVFKDRIQKASATDQFAGLAFYADTLYVKGTVGTLFKSALARIGSEYDWAGNASTLGTVGSGSPSTDLASCGVPAISVVKTQAVYTDATATTLTTDQTRIGTGQYIKYTIIGTNTGDAWARNSYIKDTLPAGVTYVPNSATVNGININAATYPFTNTVATGAVGTVAAVNTPASGQIRLDLLGNSNVTTNTYLVKVDGGVLNITNEAEIGYLNPFPSDPKNCVTGLNCGTSTFASINPSIFGTVWNDTNGSAAGTFSNIFSTGEAGTNTGTGNALYALLLDSTGKVLLSQAVGSDGKYAFQALNTNQSNLKIELSTAAGTVGAVPLATAAPAIPTGWKATSPKVTPAINLATVDLLNQDFGISLPAGMILVKRITAITDINGVTTNFTAVVDPTTTTTTNDDATRKWPVGYLKGTVNGGIVKPGDKIEYTIYYLNDGSADAKTVKICDPIRGNQKYVPGTMSMLPGSATIPISLTDLATDTTIDRANSYAAGVANVPTGCNAASSTATGTDNGGVAIQLTGTGATVQLDLSVIPGATAIGTPTSSYGWFRFTTKVNP